MSFKIFFNCWSVRTFLARGWGVAQCTMHAKLSLSECKTIFIPNICITFHYPPPTNCSGCIFKCYHAMLLQHPLRLIRVYKLDCAHRQKTIARPRVYKILSRVYPMDTIHVCMNWFHSTLLWSWMLINCIVPIYHTRLSPNNWLTRDCRL